MKYLSIEWFNCINTCDKKWFEVNYLSSSLYSVNKNIRFKILMLRSDLCDYSDIYIVVKGRITVEGDNDAKTKSKNLFFKNNAPFRWCILKINNAFIKWSSHENVLAYKKAKNICNSLNKKAKKDYFRKAMPDGVRSNRKFWNTVEPFLTSKGFLHNDNISIDINGNIMEDEQKLTKEFNSYYINIAKTTSGKPPMKWEKSPDYKNDSLITKGIIEKYKNHPSIKAIQDNFSVKKEFKMEKRRLSK